MVDTADDTKSKPGPIFSARDLSAGTLSTNLPIWALTNSNTAKLTAPCGMDSAKVAPAPRERVLNIEGFNSCVKVTLSGPRDDCIIVFIVFAGCIVV